MAVYTNIENDELDEFLNGYDIGPLLSYKGIAEGVENSNFLLHTGAGFYILTLYEKRVNAQDLPFFIDLMDHLFHYGITCPEPVRRRNGEVLGTLAGRPAAIVTFLDGVPVNNPDKAHCELLGEMMARMHLAGRKFKGHRVNALSVDAWRPMMEQQHFDFDSIEKGLEALIHAELDFLEPNWPRDLPTGVIHGDLFPDNVFFLQGKLSGFIDFYFSCNDMLAFDVAICLNAWCFDNGWNYHSERGRKLLRGYQKIRPFSDDEKKLFPILARGSAIRFLITRAIDWLSVPGDAIVVPKDPKEYIPKLKFHQKMNEYKQYGFERVASQRAK